MGDPAGDALRTELDFRYCPHCGTALIRPPAAGPAPTTARPRCARCGYVHYLNPVTVVAAILLADRDALPPSGVAIPPPAGSHVLLVRRTTTFAGAWCLPCGYVDYHEEIRAAAVREMLEETGLQTTVEQIFAVESNFHDPRTHSVGVWFLVRYLSGRLRPGDDADRAQLFALGALPDRLAFPTDRRVLASLQTAAAG